MEQLRAEVADLRRQQAVNQAHFEFALNYHNDQLEDLRRALGGRRQGRTPTEGPPSENESEVKSLHQIDPNLYDA
jgi:hypothetical protein